MANDKPRAISISQCTDLELAEALIASRNEFDRAQEAVKGVVAEINRRRSELTADTGGERAIR